MSASAESSIPRTHPALNLRRRYRRRIPGAGFATVQRVARSDGRSRVIAAREAGGDWFRLRRPTRFTVDEATYLREVHVSEVLLRRGGRRAALPLSWV